MRPLAPLPCQNPTSFARLFVSSAAGTSVYLLHVSLRHVWPKYLLRCHTYVYFSSLIPNILVMGQRTTSSYVRPVSSSLRGIHLNLKLELSGLCIKFYLRRETTGTRVSPNNDISVCDILLPGLAVTCTSCLSNCLHSNSSAECFLLRLLLRLATEPYVALWQVVL